MNYKEFAQSIKSKYPQYAEIDDKELSKRIIEKYPQYSDVTFDKEETAPSFAERLRTAAAPLGKPSVMRSIAPATSLGPIQDVFNVAGEAAAEKLGEEGVNPYVAGGLGTAVSMAPDIALTAVGGAEAKPISQGLRRTVIGALSPAESGAALESARSAAGFAKFAETAAEPRSRKAIVDFANKIQTAITDRTPQQLADVMDVTSLGNFKQLISRILDSQKVGRIGTPAKEVVSKDTLARLAKASENVSEAIKIAAPDLRQPTAEAAASLRRQALLGALGRGAKRAAPYVIGGAAGAGGLAALLGGR